MNPIFVTFSNSPKRIKLVKTFNSNVRSDIFGNINDFNLFDEIEITTLHQVGFKLYLNVTLSRHYLSFPAVRTFNQS